jgi:Tol biopolymer transport system component
MVAEEVLHRRWPGAYDAAGGEAKTIAHVDGDGFVSDWSRDGASLVYTRLDPKTGADIWLLPTSAAGDAANPVALLQSTANESQGQVSPDGKWLAYFSDEASQGQVYLRRIESDGQLSAAKWQVSSGARGVEPRWREDSKELFYLEIAGGGTTGTVTAVSIGSAPDPIGSTTPLFDVRTLTANPVQNRFLHSPAPDGQRFLVNVFASRLESSLEIIFNWAAK